MIKSGSRNSEKIRLLYVLYNENLLDSGILRSQVRKMLEVVAEDNDVDRIDLLTFVNPAKIIFQRRDWRKLKQDLANKHITLLIKPLLYPLRGSFFPGSLVSIGYSVIVSFFEKIYRRTNIVHCRSYGAGVIGYALQTMSGCKYIFDPRGPMPEEMAMNNFWAEDSLTYKAWKKFEHKMFTKSEAVIAVTPYYKRQFNESGARKTLFIPNRGDVKYFLEKSKSSTVANQAQSGNCQTLVFIGGMDARWYRAEMVARHYLNFKCVLPNLKLKLITRMNEGTIRNIFNDIGINEDDWTIEASHPDDMPQRIASASFGLILGLRPTGNWPVKFAEYVACGVPVAVEKETGSHLTHEVTKWKIGVVIDSTDPASYDGVKEIIQNRHEYYDRCREYARQHMDISKSSGQYLRLYRQLLNK